MKTYRAKLLGGPRDGWDCMIDNKEPELYFVPPNLSEFTWDRPVLKEKLEYIKPYKYVLRVKTNDILVYLYKEE